MNKKLKTEAVDHLFQAMYAQLMNFYHFPRDMK